MWELYHKEGWALKIDAFKLWCWRRLLRVPWTARKSNQSILKEISPEYSLEGLMLKLQYFGYLMGPTQWKRHWCWERVKAEGEGGNRGWDSWMASLIQWKRTWANSGRWWGTGKPGMLQYMGIEWVRHDLATEQQQFCLYSEIKNHMTHKLILKHFFLIMKVISNITEHLENK